MSTADAYLYKSKCSCDGFSPQIQTALTFSAFVLIRGGFFLHPSEVVWLSFIRFMPELCVVPPRILLAPKETIK